MELSRMSDEQILDWIEACEWFLRRDDIKDQARANQEGVLAWLRGEQERRGLSRPLDRLRGF